MIFLIRPPIAPTRARNHTDKALSGCQRNHVQASSTIAARTRLLPVFSDPLFTFAAAAREWRSAEPDISAERASITKLPYERLTHEKCGEVRTDRPQVRQRADHPVPLRLPARPWRTALTRQPPLGSISFRTRSRRSSRRFNLTALHLEEWDRRPAGARKSIARGDLVAKPLYPFTPSVAKMPSILLTIDRRSPVKSSRSRYARRASSSASLGIGAPSNRPEARPVAKPSMCAATSTTSMISVFARRARRSHR